MHMKTQDTDDGRNKNKKWTDRCTSKILPWWKRVSTVFGNMSKDIRKWIQKNDVSKLFRNRRGR